MGHQNNAFIRKTAPIIREELRKAIEKTINLFAMIPSPVMPACATTAISRDLYAGKTTIGEILLNGALAFGALKGVQFIGRGIKFVYQSGKAMFLEMRANRPVPFVTNPKAGVWKTANVSSDLALTDSTAYEAAYLTWTKNPRAPFNVVAHGDALSVVVDTQSIHPRALSQVNLWELRTDGWVELNAVQLARVIRTAPDYIKGQAINLFSCKGGQLPNGVAQQLANRMKVPVSAFSDTVGIRFDKTFTAFSKETGALGVLKTFHPQTGGTSMDIRFIPLLGIPAVALVGDQPKEERITNISPSLGSPLDGR